MRLACNELQVIIKLKRHAEGLTGGIAGLSVHPLIAFFPLDCGRSGLPAAAYEKYASPQTLVRPCPAKKISFMNWKLKIAFKQTIVDGH